MSVTDHCVCALSEDADLTHSKESICESFIIPILPYWSSSDMIRWQLISVLFNQVSWLIVANMYFADN